MSETVTHQGKLKKADLNGLTIEQWFENNCKEFGKTTKSEDTWEEEFMWQHDKGEIILYTDEIYEIIEDNKSEYEDICYLKENPDSTFDFVMQYYNGGTCLSEMIRSGLKHLSK